jgi:hypothetical protein
LNRFWCKRLLKTTNSNLSNWANTSNPYWHSGRLYNILSCLILFYTSWSILVFIWDLWTISFQSYHSSWYSNNCILIIHLSILESLTIYTLRSTKYLIILTLISKSSHHHIRWLLVRIILLHQSMGHISIHHYIIFFYDCYSIHILIILCCLLNILRLTILMPIMKLLRLYNVSSLHLRIFYLNLRIIEYEIVIINVFNYFNWLILVFLFWFWRAATPSMRAI